MSVLIKGMEMPKNCDECLYSSWENFYQIYVCNATRKYEPVLFDKKQVKSTNTVRSGRADNCPLVEVSTPHGRLIDADALMDTLQELFDERCEDAKFSGNRSACVTWNDAIYHIKSAPTIIEAEGEQE